jgi:transcriptional regulator with XRE-family HTH domain
MVKSARSSRRSGPSKKPPAAHHEFGARLAAFRSGAQLTQSELASKLGVSRRQIAYYESGHGRPPGALLGLLADLFRVSTDVLLGHEVSKKPASRLSHVALALLRKIESMGADVSRRLETHLEQFIVAEQWRRRPRARRARAAD